MKTPTLEQFCTRRVLIILGWFLFITTCGIVLCSLTDRVSLSPLAKYFIVFVPLMAIVIASALVGHKLMKRTKPACPKCSHTLEYHDGPEKASLSCRTCDFRREWDPVDHRW